MHLSSRQVPNLFLTFGQRWEPCKPCAARGFLTFLTFLTYFIARMRPRVHACTCTYTYTSIRLGRLGRLGRVRRSKGFMVPNLGGWVGKVGNGSVGMGFGGLKWMR